MQACLPACLRTREHAFKLAICGHAHEKQAQRIMARFHTFERNWQHQPRTAWAPNHAVAGRGRLTAASADDSYACPSAGVYRVYTCIRTQPYMLLLVDPYPMCAWNQILVREHHRSSSCDAPSRSSPPAAPSIPTRFGYARVKTPMRKMDSTTILSAVLRFQEHRTLSSRLHPTEPTLRSSGQHAR